MKTVIHYPIFILLALLMSCSKTAQWQVYSTSNTPLQSDLIRQIILENNNLAWIGTYGGGLYKITGDVWKKVDSPFEGTYILSLVTDKKNGLWVGTARHGAYYYNGSTWENYSVEQGLLGENVWDIFIEPVSDAVWLCNRYRGICRKDGDSISCFDTRQGLPDREVTCIELDSRGWVWVGTAHGGICGLYDNQRRYINSRNGLSGNYIRALICDSIPRLAGSWDGGLDWYKGKHWEHIQDIKKPVVFLGYDKDSVLWVGTWGNGVYYHKAYQWHQLTAENSGLPNNYVIDIDFAENGQIYFATSKGAAKYTPHKL